MKTCTVEKYDLHNYDEFFLNNTSLIKRTIVCVFKKFNMLFDVHFVDEMFQVIALKIIQKDYLKRYDSAKGKISSWLYVIVERSIVDELRKLKKNKTETLDEAFSIGTITYFHSVKNLIPKGLLTERQYQVVLLTVESELSTTDVATLLSISESSVRCLKHQALRRLRIYYTTNYYGGDCHDNQ